VRPIKDSESFQRDFKRLLALSEGQINKLAEISNSKSGFALTEEQLHTAASSLGIDEEDMTTIIAVAGFLYRRASAEEIFEEGAEEICTYAESIGIEDCDTKISAIRNLLAKKEEHEYRLLEVYSESLAVPTISDVDVACDIRAVVAPDSDEIIGYVPVALMGIEVEHSPTDKRTLTLQLGEEELDGLLEEITKAKRLLTSMKERFSGKIDNTQ